MWYISQMGFSLVEFLIYCTGVLWIVTPPPPPKKKKRWKGLCMYGWKMRPRKGSQVVLCWWRPHGDAGWRNADWHSLTHSNILRNRREIKWNAPFLSTKQAIYYLFITLTDNILNVVCFMCNRLSSTIHKIVKKTRWRALDLWSQFCPK